MLERQQEVAGGLALGGLREKRGGAETKRGKRKPPVVNNRPRVRGSSLVHISTRPCLSAARGRHLGDI